MMMEWNPVGRRGSVVVFHDPTQQSAQDIGPIRQHTDEAVDQSAARPAMYLHEPVFIALRLRLFGMGERLTACSHVWLGVLHLCLPSKSILPSQCAGLRCDHPAQAQPMVLDLKGV